MLVLGGLGYPEPVLKQSQSTFDNDVMSDMWQYNIRKCMVVCNTVLPAILPVMCYL